MTIDTPLLEAQRVGRRHPDGQAWLLKDVSIQVHPGEAVAVQGPSGAGKTLLLRALALLDPIDEGEIRFHGHCPRHHDVPDTRRQAIYLHQRPELTGPTVEAALRLPFTLAVHRGRDFDRPWIAERLERLGRDASFFAQPTSELSGGEQQIVALLRAMQLDPVVLLLDEPTASLDAQASGAIERLVLDWKAERPDQRAFVWVGHDTAQATRMTDRVIPLRHGRLDQEASP
ncbi:MAG: ATP-binding cassette domain-containing protein [Pirellulales bacterium]|nr:ATP-binding cassette domain-containing protein [Pirellulales bacterium]